MGWWWLMLAAAFEVAWTIGLKYTQGFTRPAASAATIAAMVLSMWLLSLAARTLPIGTAYAVWTGIGVVGAATWGIVMFGESRDALRIGCLVLIVLGTIGLRATAR